MYEQRLCSNTVVVVVGGCSCSGSLAVVSPLALSIGCHPSFVGAVGAVDVVGGVGVGAVGTVVIGAAGAVGDADSVLVSVVVGAASLLKQWCLRC